MFRLGAWMAKVRRDDIRDVWIISAIDHSMLTLTDECDGGCSPEEALDRAEALAP